MVAHASISCRRCGHRTRWPSLTGWLCIVLTISFGLLALSYDFQFSDDLQMPKILLINFNQILRISKYSIYQPGEKKWWNIQHILAGLYWYVIPLVIPCRHYVVKNGWMDKVQQQSLSAAISKTWRMSREGYANYQPTLTTQVGKVSFKF